MEGRLGHCYPQRGKTKTFPNKLQAYCSNSAPRQSVRETDQKQTGVPPRETGHTSSMPGRFPKRSKLHGACPKALRPCQKKLLRAAVRLSPPSLTLREPLTQSGTPSSLTRCRLWASQADCTNSCKCSWTPDDGSESWRLKVSHSGHGSPSGQCGRAHAFQHYAT